MVGRRDVIKRGAGVIAAAGIGTGAALKPANAQGQPGLWTDDPQHVVLMVIDRSGSMASLQQSVVDGVNAFLNEQHDKSGMHIGLVQFDSYKTREGCICEPIFGFTPAHLTPRLTLNDYQPRGSTPVSGGGRGHQQTGTGRSSWGPRLAGHPD